MDIELTKLAETLEGGASVDGQDAIDLFHTGEVQPYLVEVTAPDAELSQAALAELEKGFGTGTGTGKFLVTQGMTLNELLAASRK